MNRGSGTMGGQGLAVALAAGAALAVLAPAAQAQTSSQTSPPQAAAPRAPAEAEDDDPTRVSEVVVSAAAVPYQAQPGAVVGDIQPELQLNPSEIQSYGVSTLTELLDELAPETRSDRGRGGETPVVLLNGKRISGFNEVRDIPTEAILRVDILPEEVALKYGFTADQRVVNFVLRPRFRALTNEATVGAPTAGGQVNGALEADRFGVRRDDRVNIDLKFSGNTDLTYAARGLNGAASGLPYALQGNIAAGSGLGEIDPALSALAGRPVTVAGAPAAAAGRAPTLAEFAATGRNADDLGRYRDLASANQNLQGNLVVARALGGGWSGTLNASLTGGASQSLQGLPSLALTVPAGGPWSPFASNVRLYRYLDALGPVRQDTSTWSGHLGGALNRQAGTWRFNLTAAYDHTDTLSTSGAGVAAAPLQALLNAGSASFNPYAAIPAAMLTRLPDNEARSLSDSGQVQAVVNGPLVKVPAGQLSATVKLGDTQSGFAARSFRLGSFQAVSLSRNDLNGQLSLDLPLTSRRNEVLPQMGDLSVNVNVSADQISDFGAIRSLGYGLNWTPIQQVRLIVSQTRDEAAPSVSQLGSPTVVTPGVRLFDFATGQTVDVTQITGPNPDLVGDVRQVFKVGLTLKPWTGRQFTLTANYVDQRTDDPISTFPAATAAIEAAFPGRFLRDATGTLAQIDQRPVNFAWSRRQTLRWGFNYSRPVGKPPERPQRPFPPPPRAQAQDQAQGPQQGQPGGPPPQGGQAPPSGQEPPRARAQGERPPAGGRGPGPGGPGGFGGGRGGFAGGPGGGAGQGRFQVAAFHTVYFVNQTLVRPGGPLLNLLGGAPAGRTGGQPAHAVEGQLGYTQNGLGLRLNASWVQGTRVEGGGFGPGALTFSDLTTVHLRLFANLGQMRGVVRDHPWLRGSRLTIGVFNVFDQRLRVRDAAGATPLGYQPALLDPQGRQVSVTFRKLMF